MPRRIILPLAVGSAVTVVSGYLLIRSFRRQKKALNSTIYLIRHGESTVNARAKEYHEHGDAHPGRAYHEVSFFDADLTNVGREQASINVLNTLRSFLQPHDREGGMARLVVTSTLRRALETATRGVLPLLPPDNFTTWLALDYVREAMTLEIHTENDNDIPVNSDAKPCNARDPLNQARTTFPHVDFSQCHEEDPLEPIETIGSLDMRIDEFIIWLRTWERQTRQEHGDVRIDVVVVSHYVFLRRLLSRVHGMTDSRSCGLANCEVRMLPLSSVVQCKLTERTQTQSW
eukprot:TRINITY_DN54132_c0_g1_i1.p1 TRINITY_DN54132_c0_g1~~TRINITY_DN54132_c0_g1_i1.p1  ORF type:complete len:298 (+),score=27.27 TRINITY_DN54132_c0_g1_i1:29-895(+)